MAASVVIVFDRLFSNKSKSEVEWPLLNQNWYLSPPLCTQRLYLIKYLKHQGMSQQQLSVVAYSIIVSCRLPGCWVKTIESILFLNCTITINDLINRSDYEFFKNICSTSHSLYHLLLPYRTSELRARSHPFQLPECMAGQTNFYSQLLISAIWIIDINNSNCWCH